MLNNLTNIDNNIDSNRWSWDEDQTVYNGTVYGYSYSDTPSEWVDGQGWRPLVWASYHGLSLKAKRSKLKAMILENEEYIY